MPRPRGLSRGWKTAVRRHHRYQRYYNRGSQANWERMKREEDVFQTNCLKFFGYIALAAIVFCIAVIGTAYN